MLRTNVQLKGVVGNQDVWVTGADLDRVFRFGKPGQILLEDCRNFLENVFVINKIIKISSSALSIYLLKAHTITEKMLTAICLTQ